MQKTVNTPKAANKLVILKDDYDTLLSYLKGGYNKTAFDRKNAEELETELKRAKLVSKKAFPDDVVRINSKVTVKELSMNKEMEFILVTPDKADIKQKKISIMAPMGTALLGFREGEEVKWEVPSGKKTFTILKVENTEEEEN